jgi:Flp pilus assembly protein TadG
MVLALVMLCGFVALAVDVGLVAVAKTECQNAADTAALTGARSLDGGDSPDLTTATANARAAATSNTILGGSVQASEVTVQHGAYHYDTTTQKFSAQFPPVAPDTYNLTRVTVARQCDTTFARVLGITKFDVTARGTSAHRPRDVTIVLDFSGSMNDESDLWNNVSTDHMGSLNFQSNNTDTVFPKFGHYSDTTTAALRTTSTDPRTGKSNVSQAILGIPALVGDFYDHARGSTPHAAFATVPFTTPDNYATTSPGDKYMTASGSTAPGKTVQEITGATSTQISQKKDAVMPSYSNFQGYTRGPGHWGKTFFIWPPDPNLSNGTRDWRSKFFGTTDNSKLWEADGDWKTPSGNYTINYAAILNWIKNTGACPFPTRLRAGRILYYDQIPTDVPASAYTHANANSQITDPNQRFWKEYIDYVVGVWRDPYGTVIPTGSQGTYPVWSLGPDYAWGTVRIGAPVTGYSTSPTTRMHPQDNPKRPRHRLWFGPMTMVQFLSDTGLLPGTAHDLSLYPAKLGISGALQDIKNNHPNDLVSLILFSRPQFDNDPTGTGRFNTARFNLSRDYTGMIDALWFPPNSGTSDVRPWDANGIQTPRSSHDYAANTATSYGLMLAYNQFSGSSTLRSQTVGGLGRKGVQRLVVLETDGMANVNSVATGGFANSGVDQSYYRIRTSDTVNSGTYSQTALLQVVQAICNKDDGTPGTSPGYTPNPGYPGYAQTRKPVLIHTIAFGAIFEPTAAGTEQTTVVSLLQQISAIGGTRFPSSPTDATDGYKWCIGTLDLRKDKLRQAFSKVMDDGISVSIVD